MPLDEAGFGSEKSAWRPIHLSGPRFCRAAINVRTLSNGPKTNGDAAWPQACGTKLERAQILPAADAGLGDGAIAADPGQRLTIYRTKPRFVEGNPEAAR